jgi:transcription initiation factor TFIIH subunit 4
MDPIEALAFLFMLGNLELGRGYSTENLTATQLTMLEDLAETGFIYRRSKTSKRFYPTRLASSLSSAAFSQSDSTAFPTSSSSLVTAATATRAAAGREPAQGFIIVETNFRVYAYTSNLLQIAVLNLFVQFKARFPDMVVGEITRGKMKGALEKGITADQVRSGRCVPIRCGSGRQRLTREPHACVCLRPLLRSLAT